jgi:hypothetical protein
MRTIAVLGATGQTGQELVKLLLTRHTDCKLHVYARNADSLYSKIPSLRSAQHAKVFIGSLDDVTFMQGVLQDVDVIISTIASNQNSPGCDVVTRASYSIVKALEAEAARTSSSPSQPDRDTRKVALPRLVLLSSVTLNPRRMAEIGDSFGYKFVYTAFRNVYDDLKRAIAYLEQQSSLLELVLAEPGGLIHRPATGIELVPDEMGSEFVPYPDFADAMIQMGLAESGGGGKKNMGKGQGQVKHFGIRVKGEEKLGATEFFPLLRYMLPGFVASFLPWLWKLLENWWPK